MTNQYGRPGRAARNWGLDTIEGDLPEDELIANRQDQNEDNARYRYRDEDYYASKEYDMADIQVPILSVGNWGGTAVCCSDSSADIWCWEDMAGVYSRWYRRSSG